MEPSGSGARDNGPTCQPDRRARMQRLTQFDVSRQFVTARGRHTAQYVFGGVSAGAMIGLRSIVDVVASASGPFALIYPTVLLATLYGRLRAGLTALALTFAWAWYFVLPAPRSFLFVQPGDPARVVLNALCAIVVVIFAEAFRRAAHSTVDEIQQAADRRLMLLAEVEHRTKNNFALVASMLEFQKRRLDDPSLQAHLSDAVIRVRIFCRCLFEPGHRPGGIQRGRCETLSRDPARSPATRRHARASWPVPRNRRHYIAARNGSCDRPLFE